MKKNILICLVLTLILFGGIYFYKNQTSTPKNEEKPTVEAVTLLFSDQYNRPANDFVIKVTKDDGSFAQGSINIKNEPGGGMWFAAKTQNGWELAFDGNGMISCDTANIYDLPTDMVPQCLDTTNQNKLIER